MNPWLKLAAALSLALILLGSYRYLARAGDLDILMNAETLRGKIDGLGIAGPLVIIGLMTLAIVLSPLPSAPIALASGAAFGHLWGTLYVLAGAELGALIAFFIARALGYELLRSWLGKERLEMSFLGSQNMLMGTVFVTRLLPFISFDIVSYAAGLTPLSTWRFALATFAGIVPASFLLSHFGSEMLASDPRQLALAALLLGGLTLIPLGARFWRQRRSPPAEKSP